MSVQHSFKLSSVALCVVAAFGCSNCFSGDLINENVDGSGYWLTTDTKVSGSTLTNTTNLLMIKGATLTISGGNVLTVTGTGQQVVSAFEGSFVDISGENTLTATGNFATVALSAANDSVVTISGKNTLIGATAIQASYSSNVAITGENTLMGAIAVDAGANSTVTISGKNTFEVHPDQVKSYGGTLINVATNATVSISGENNFIGDGYSSCLICQASSQKVEIAGNNNFYNKGTNGIGVKVTGEGVSFSGINRFKADNAISQTSDSLISFEAESSTIIEESKTGITAKNILIGKEANVEVTASEVALDLQGELQIDGGSVTLTAIDDGDAIRNSSNSNNLMIVVDNEGSFIVNGDVSSYSGSYSFAEGSVARFSNLTVNNTFVSENSTISVEKINNKGEMDFIESTIIADGTDNMNFGTVNATSTKFNIGKGKYEFAQLNGVDNELYLSDTAKDKVIINSSSAGSSLAVIGLENADNYATPKEYAQALAAAVTKGAEGQGSAANSIVTPEGSIYAGTVSRVENGQLVWDDSSLRPSLSLEGLNSLSVLSAVNWRHEMNSLSKRMGELRDSPTEIGAWVRIYGSEMAYGSQNINAKNKTIQIGSDISLGDWRVGVSANYTDSTAEYRYGEASSDSYGFAIYGTWLIPCGAYVDLIAKYMRMDNDFSLNGMDGSFNNNAFSASVETGYRIDLLNKDVFIEPQVSLSYGKVKGDNFETGNGVQVDQDDYDSFLGRVGLRAGFKFPEDRGTIYARVSGVYDFEGEMNSTAMNGNAEISLHENIGGGYVEYGVGANLNWTKNAYTYIDLERTSGGDIRENYRWNIGFRYVF